MISQHSEVSLVSGLAERLYIEFVTSKEAREELEDGGDPEVLHEEYAMRAWAAAETFHDMRARSPLGASRGTVGTRRGSRRVA